jgi:hypothetical protein
VVHIGSIKNTLSFVAASAAKFGAAALTASFADKFRLGLLRKDLADNCKMLVQSSMGATCYNLCPEGYIEKCFDVCSKAFEAIKTIDHRSPTDVIYNRYSVIYGRAKLLWEDFSGKTFSSNYTEIMGENETFSQSNCASFCFSSFIPIDSETLAALVLEKAVSVVPAVAIATTVDIVAETAGLKGNTAKDAFRLVLGSVACGCAATVTGAVAADAVLAYLVYKSATSTAKATYSLIKERYQQKDKPA